MREISGHVTCTSYDYREAETVPVIASFDTAGHICPLYVRIDGHAFRVDTWTVTFHYAHVCEFRCEVIDGALRRPLSLTYYTEARRWTVP